MYLDKYIQQGIAEVFIFSKVDPVQISNYIQQAGPVELSTNYNRRVITICNNCILSIKRLIDRIDFNNILQVELMELIATRPYKSLSPNYALPTEIVERELNHLKR